MKILRIIGGFCHVQKFKIKLLKNILSEFSKLSVANSSPMNVLNSLKFAFGGLYIDGIKSCSSKNLIFIVTIYIQGKLVVN